MRPRRNAWLDETIPSGSVDIIRATRVGSERNAHEVSTAICRTKNGYRSRDSQILYGTLGVSVELRNSWHVAKEHVRAGKAGPQQARTIKGKNGSMPLFPPSTPG